MLIRFVISNFMSIGKECEFNMLPAPLKNHQNHIYATSKVKVLKGAAIYGANGAGKSNIIKAIGLLQNMILTGDIQFDMNRIKYRLDNDINRRPTVFDVEFGWNKKFYGYHIEIQDNIITNESLYELGFQAEDRLLFERSYSSEDKRITVTLKNNSASGAKNKLLTQLLAENILNNKKLLLSNHQMLGSEKISNAFSWFAEGLQVLYPSTRFGGITKVLSESERFHQFANDVITRFDTGVTGIGVDEIALDEFFGKENEPYKQQIKESLAQSGQDVPVPMSNGTALFATVNARGEYVVKKTVTFHQDALNHQVAFDMMEESDGTQRLLDIIPAIDMYLHNGATIIADEINQSLHPSLLKDLMYKIMNESSGNEGQFIITTHESHLLDYDIYRQDEIWFVEKRRGCTEIYPLTDFKPRADLQLQKGYLLGRFGAIPFLANLKDINWDDHHDEN